MRSIAAPLSSTTFTLRQSQSQPSLMTVSPLPSWKFVVLKAITDPPLIEIAIGVFTLFTDTSRDPCPPQVSPQTMVKRCHPAVISQSVSVLAVYVRLSTTHLPSTAKPK